jgi:glyoxylase-like metal-dependent hydrolase (beta-lactamase superfamily II)
MRGRTSAWHELGDGVFARRYAFYDQQIGVVLGSREAMVVDTRMTPRMAREVIDDLRALTIDPVAVVVNTHWHYDHTFGNQAFRPAFIWGHARTPSRLREHGRVALAAAPVQVPDLAPDLAEVVIDPPDRLLREAAVVEVGGRNVELRYLGRGHTDTDIVVRVPDAGVVFAGDLVVGGAAPNFTHAFPLEWPDSVAALVALVRGPVVPGHGPVGGRSLVEAQLRALREIVALAREVETGRLTVAGAVATAPFDRESSAAAIARCLAQLAGKLR